MGLRDPNSKNGQAGVLRLSVFALLWGPDLLSLAGYCECAVTVVYRVSLPLSLSLYVYTYTYIHTYIYIYIYRYMCVCVYIYTHMYKCMYLCICLCVYIYIYIQIIVPRSAIAVILMALLLSPLCGWGFRAFGGDGPEHNPNASEPLTPCRALSFPYHT